MSITLTDLEYERAARYGDILAKAWRIAIGEESEAEYDTNNFYDLIREGVEAKKKIATDKLSIEQFVASRFEEAIVKFDVTMKAVSDTVEHCAMISDKYEDEACCYGGCGRIIAELIRRGE